MAAKKDSTEKSKKRRRGPNARGEERRKKLIDSAEALLAEHPIPDVSYADIAKHAGLPLTSCYYFYADKFDLIRALNLRTGDMCRDELDTLRHAPCPDTWEDLVALVMHTLEAFIARHPVSIELWCSGNMPPAIHSETKMRDIAVSATLRGVFEAHFVLPERSEEEWATIFHVAFEILDHIMSLAYQPEARQRALVDEAVVAVRAYLRNYLPPALIRREQQRRASSG